MCYKAVDRWGRIVYFKEKIDFYEVNSFPAEKSDGQECYYKVYHRTDGPAIIDGQSRRWFFDGEDHTQCIEYLISEMPVEVFLGDESFTFNENGKNMLNMCRL